MRRVLLIFGTRPEAIKMAPLILAMRDHPGFEPVTCVTAQHRQMLDQVLDWFGIQPDYDLNLMQPNQTLSGLTARALTGLSEVLSQAKAETVLVQGDTTTAMVGALAAFYQRLPVGHVEAGLRTADIYDPFPEEVNRRLISVMGRYHFTPTPAARDALLREGADPAHIHVTGNTVIDALKWTVAKQHPLVLPGVPLSDDKRLVMITAHRRESFGPAFEGMCRAMRRVAEAFPDVRLVYPVHLNPNVQEPARRILSGVDRVHLIDPLPYPDFAHLMAQAELILTDSGGVQEEAPALGVPVLVMRRTTERPEAVEAGVAKLVGTDEDAIFHEAERLLSDPAAHRAMVRAVSPFGDGQAAERILEILQEG